MQTNTSIIGAFMKEVVCLDLRHSLREYSEDPLGIILHIRD